MQCQAPPVGASSFVMLLPYVVIGVSDSTVDWTLKSSLPYNSYHGEFILGNKNIFASFLQIFFMTEKTQSVEIHRHWRPGYFYSTWSVAWLLMWWYKQPQHQQPCCWPDDHWIFQLQNQKGELIGHIFCEVYHSIIHCLQNFIWIYLLDRQGCSIAIQNVSPQ